MGVDADESQSDGAQGESTGRAWRLARKELREILRDRRTVITLILMPLLVYPLLGSVMSKGVLSTLSTARKIDCHVFVETEADAQEFAAAMALGEQILAEEAPPKNGEERATSESVTDGRSNSLNFPTDPNLKISVFPLPGKNDGETLEKHIADGFADLAVRVQQSQPEEFTQGLEPLPFQDWELIQRANSALSKRCFEAITKRLEALNRRYLDSLVETGRIPPVRPATIQTRSIESTYQAPSPLVTFIPLVLVLMTMTGAVYPAIDLTAGERERGTMEILVAAPVSRMTLLAGKFVAVLVVALLTASMNLISMFATLFALGLEGTVLGSINATMIVQVIVLMIVFAAFFSAVLLSITSVARSFKEAQAYLVPLMLVSLSPGIFALMPEVKMNGLMAVTPLINTVLMGRDLLQGNVNLLMFAIVLISTALYGVLALSLAARIFGSDAVLYGSAGTWNDLLRRPTESSAVAPVPISMSCLAILFSLFIIVGSLPGKLTSNLFNQLLLNAVVLLILFVGVPLLFSAAAKVRPVTGFALRLPKWQMWLVALLLGCSLWPFLYEMQVRTLTEDRIAFLTKLFEQLELNLSSIPLWLKLLSLSVAPAMCEEFFFRGFLQTSIRSKSSAALAILSTGVLFGLFHVIVKDALLFERLLPSTLMGIVLGIVRERSGSVLPGMLLHVLHNGLLLTIAEYEDQLSNYGIGILTHQHLPTTLLLYAAIPVTVAGVILWTKRSSISPESSS